MTALILWGLILGIACGLFFGEYCAWLTPIGDAFVGLLQMTVLPYITFALVSNIGRLTFEQGKRMARVGTAVMLVLWVVGVAVFYLATWALPEWQSASFFSTSSFDTQQNFDLLGMLIPANLFHSLANNFVPAIVVFCVCVGIALIGMQNKDALLDQLDVLVEALVRVNMFVVKLTPIGVFAIAASAAGTMTVAEADKLQAYLLIFTGAVLLLAFWILPASITFLTPFRYRDVLRAAREPLVTAFATGKVMVVLPMLIENLESMFRERYGEDQTTSNEISTLVTIAYPFPHLGKLAGLLFVPFTAWYMGSPLTADDYPRLFGAGVISYFAGPLVAIPFLLDMLRLPSDMFQLFLVAGIYCARVGDLLGAMHLAWFTTISTCATQGLLQTRWRQAGLFLIVTGVMAVGLIAGTRLYLARVFKDAYQRDKIIASLYLLEEAVPAVVLNEPTANPVPLREGQSRLDRMRERGIIRIGFNSDSLPFAFFNNAGELVGFDIEMAHDLAREKNVTIEFVPFERDTLEQQLNDDHFDIAMSATPATMDLFEKLYFSGSYLDVRPALAVRDHRDKEFDSFAVIRERDQWTVGVPRVGDFDEKLRSLFPNAKVVHLHSLREFF
ncbi:MAG: cation:dicarboxylase symporter family transporter, partial [Pirellulales bacterium]